ncbi:hypothetical protein [Pseudoalteromonas sp. SaAl2]
MDNPVGKAKSVILTEEGLKKQSYFLRSYLRNSEYRK